MQDNFLTQLIASPTRGDMILDLMVTHTSRLFWDVHIGGSDHVLVEFAVLRDTGQKRKVKEIVPFMTSKADTLVTTAEEKAEVLDNVSASVFSDSFSSHTSRVTGPQDRN